MGQKRLMVSESATVQLSGADQAQSFYASRVHLTPGDILPAWVLAHLRTDHAGEVGAVCIYQGVLQFARDPVLCAFAEHHLATEQNHLRLISGWLPAAQYSRLLPLWRLAGFLTGALPALFGPKAVYATIEAVETFVNHHYEEQIIALTQKIELRNLRQTLLDCQADEVAHRDEAAAASQGFSQSGWVLRAWCAMVGAGSKAAVTLIRHI
jgi:ubiquinone biosynthesis monooxygenase Coq7